MGRRHLRATASHSGKGPIGVIGTKFTEAATQPVAPKAAQRRAVAAIAIKDQGVILLPFAAVRRLRGAASTSHAEERKIPAVADARYPRSLTITCLATV
jgi:hypothetical protein